MKASRIVFLIAFLSQCRARRQTVEDQRYRKAGESALCVKNPFIDARGQNGSEPNSNDSPCGYLHLYCREHPSLSGSKSRATRDLFRSESITRKQIPRCARDDRKRARGSGWQGLG